MKDLMEFKKHWDQQNKRDGAGQAMFNKDAKPPAVHFSAGDDNCDDVLHPVRWCRNPIAAPETYAHLVPIRHDVIYKQLQLTHLGAANVVHERVIGRAHDRAVELRLCMFHKRNYNKRNSGTEELGDGWENPAELDPVKDAVQNFAAVYHELWPRDPAPIVIQRVLTMHRYGAGIEGKEGLKAKVVCDFFDAVMLANAGRAARQETGVAAKEAKEIWAETLEKYDVAAGYSRNKKPSGGGGGNGGGENSNSNGKFSWKGKGAPGRDSGTAVRVQCRYNGKLVCYLYNHRSGCNRTKKGDGCEDARGGEFAHVCNNQEKGKYCYGAHCRETTHK